MWFHIFPAEPESNLPDVFKKVFPMVAGLRPWKRYLPPLRPWVNSSAGDIRHNFASTGLCRKDLGFKTKWGLEAGLPRLSEWVQNVGCAPYELGKAAAELESRGLLHSGKRLGN